MYQITKVRFLVLLNFSFLSGYATNFHQESHLKTRIVGGQVAFAGQYPFMAAIHKTTKTGQYFCGGTLLNSEWVVTSGSCVVEATLFKIRLGATNLTANEASSLELATDDFVAHPEFNPDTLHNDLGLIKFRMKITFNLYIRPVTYLPSSELLPGSSGVVNIGWGQTSDDSPGISDSLHFVTLAPLDNHECKIYYGDQITDEMVCAGGNFNEGFCLGDTGTPLVRVRNGPTFTLVGIASFISGNGCDSSEPSGYTRTLNYVDWIKNITNY